MTGQFEPRGAKAGRVDLVSFPQAGVAVVFGANGGIGGALVEAIRAAERFEHVVAFSRSTSPSIDLLDEASLERAAAFAASKATLNNYDFKLALWERWYNSTPDGMRRP